MKKHIIKIALFSILFVPACNYMDELPSDYHTPEAAFQMQTTYERNINQGYAYIRSGFNRIGGSFLDGATDDGTATMQSSSIHKLAQGYYSAQSPIENCWNNSYTGIRQTLFTEKYLTEVQLFISDMTTEQVDAIKDEGKAQMKALRALYEFDLLRHYGGYPIIDKYMEIADPWFTTAKRNTFEECVNNIVNLCDSAVENLEITNTTYGRMEVGSALAIKAKTLVYAASALYNRPSNTNPLIGYVNATPQDVEARWKKAAEACAAVFNLKAGSRDRYSLHSDYESLFVSSPNTEYIVFCGAAKSNGLENRQYPPTLSRNSGGGTVPSQQFVDAFTLSDGSAYVRAAGEAPVYTGRDPRFAQIVGYNGSTYGPRGTIYTQLGTGETNDGLNKVKDLSTNTGYYLKKFIDTKINFKVGSPGNAFHLHPIVRLADVYLMYAEAMTHAYGFESDPMGYGLTGKAAVQLVRTRAGFNAATDKYFTGVDLANKDAVLQKIYDERRIELAFEEHRYFDLLRWMKTDVLSQPIKGMRIDNDGGNLTYTEIVVDNQRVFDEKMYFTPIPKNETLVFKSIDQNPGW